MPYEEPETDARPDSPGYKSSGELAALSNADLADYIAACTSDYDGTSQSVRVALVRLLRAGALPINDAQ